MALPPRQPGRRPPRRTALLSRRRSSERAPRRPVNRGRMVPAAAPSPQAPLSSPATTAASCLRRPHFHPVSPFPPVFLRICPCPLAAFSSPRPCPTPTATFISGISSSTSRPTSSSRFQKLRGHRAIYPSADDTHRHGDHDPGPGRGPQRAGPHRRDAGGRPWPISPASRSSSTITARPSSAANRRLVRRDLAAIREKGLVASRDVQQLFDPQAGVFLADRFVRGTCPRCRAADQYGDSCEQCRSHVWPGRSASTR